MTATVDYAGETLDFPDLDDRLIGVWHGPLGLPTKVVADLLRSSLEGSPGLPSLSQAVVPGDRVALAVDPRVPELATAIAVVVNLLEAAGIDRPMIRVVATSPVEGWDRILPAGVTGIVHDPDDREKLAYLATTTGGRRIYLDRELTDADFVLPIGRLGVDSTLGNGGPWGTIFPGLSDRETLRDLARHASAQGQATALEESFEVGWLIGNLFQIGVMPGVTGAASVVSGMASSVREIGLKAAEDAWTFCVKERADLVVVGVSEPTAEATWSAFATGASLVRRGGKVAALSGASGPIGAAASALSGVEGLALGKRALAGSEDEPDFASAVLLNESLAWADLYLYSHLDPEAIEDLGIIALSRPEEARRLAGNSADLLLLSHADRTRGVAEEDQS